LTYRQDYVMGCGEAYKVWLRIDEATKDTKRTVTAWHEGERYVCAGQMADLYRACSGGVGVVIVPAAFVYNGVWLWREGAVVREAAKWGGLQGVK